MSNIHGMNDFSNSNNNVRSNSNQRSPLVNNRFNSEGDPRNQRFFSFLKNFCCPNFTIKSFIFFITIIDVILYIVTLTPGLELTVLGKTQILAPKRETLIKYGALV